MKTTISPNSYGTVLQRVAELTELVLNICSTQSQVCGACAGYNVSYIHDSFTQLIPDVAICASLSVNLDTKVCVYHIIQHGRFKML